MKLLIAGSNTTTRKITGLNICWVDKQLKLCVTYNIKTIYDFRDGIVPDLLQVSKTFTINI